MIPIYWRWRKNRKWALGRAVPLRGQEPEAHFYLLLPQLPQTAGANIFSLEDGHIVNAIAEDTGRTVLFQNDVASINEDFHGFFLADIQRAAQLGGQDNPAHFINAPDDAG